MTSYKQMMWEHWHYRFGLAGEGQADIIQKYLEAQRGRVVSVGCGPDGGKIARLAGLAESLIAVDREDVLAAAKNSCVATNVQFLADDAQNMRIRTGWAHHVIALGLFAYVRDADPVFAEFRRICKAGGYVIITNSVSRSKPPLIAAAAKSGLVIAEEATGYCPAASGDIKQRYLLAFRKEAARKQPGRSARKGAPLKAR